MYDKNVFMQLGFSIFLQMKWSHFHENVRYVIIYAGSHFSQTLLKLLHLLYNSMREIDSYIWMLWESLLHLLYNSMREIDFHMWMLQESLWESILWFSFKVRPWFLDAMPFFTNKYQAKIKW